MSEHRRPAVATGGIELKDDVTAVSELSTTTTMDVESLRKKLRQRWELASVLNFLHVFEPLIGSGLKVSAEDVETSLIEQNKTLARLHIALLKGILPDRKPLKDSDAWVIALSKTLSPWWTWVAEGNFPLAGVKGEEISLYKELEPTTRLLILKALCEVRAEQYDAVSYINDTMKDSSEVSKFRKDRLAGDGNGITFWYDGDETIGHRLYKEVYFFENARVKGKDTVAGINSKWETLATNLEEFQKIVNELSSSEVDWEVALSKSLESEVIPVLEKQLKKKEREQLRQQREQMLLAGFRSSGIARSCRNQKTINYRFDDYDRAITEAIKYTNKRKTNEERKAEEEPSCRRKRIGTTSDGSNNSEPTSADSESTESDDERNTHQGRNDIVGSSGEEYDEEEEDDGDQGKVFPKKQNNLFVNRSKGLRFGKRLAGVPGHTAPESMNLGAKRRLRQRPSVNTATETVVVADSEDESSSAEDSEN